MAPERPEEEAKENLSLDLEHSELCRHCSSDR